MEENQKWKLLSDILDEIEVEETRNEHLGDHGKGKILVVVKDDRTCAQLQVFGLFKVLTFVLYPLFNKTNHFFPLRNIWKWEEKRC